MRKITIALQIVFVVVALQGCNFISAAGFSSQGQPIKEVQGDLTFTEVDPTLKVDHSAWTTLLQKYVDKDGFVSYKGFLNDRDALNRYLQHLAFNPPKDNWNVPELLAYYINLYNAHTLNLILDNYPVKSIKDISGPWTRSIVIIGDKNLSLGSVENGILRKMNEPRIHFAINCASISCPNLLNEAFIASKINEQLERVSFNFINSDKNEISSNNPKLSKIFKWYKKDFKVNGEKDLIGFINKYSKIKIKSDASLDYKEYNWNLNEK